MYLSDDNETPYSVLVPSGIGVLMEYWKLKKTIVIEEIPNTDGSPKWQFWKRYTYRTDSSDDKKTRSFDEQAMKYLFYIMTPCLIGCSIYSAIYDQHKGWYSFLIRVQVRFIYWTGFIQMTPQIFINYKKKSVG